MKRSTAIMKIFEKKDFTVFEVTYDVYIMSSDLTTYIRYDYDGYSEWYQIKIHPSPLTIKCELLHNQLEKIFADLL